MAGLTGMASIAAGAWMGLVTLLIGAMPAILAAGAAMSVLYGAYKLFSNDNASFGVGGKFAGGLDNGGGVTISSKASNDNAPKRSAIVGNESNRAMQLFQEAGYTREQAAGWTANMMAESGGAPTVRGDGGAASGLFQWHADRVQKIMEKTGIDVRSASFDDQIKAAIAEASYRDANKDGMTDEDKIKATNDPHAAASYISKYFEVAAGKYGYENEALIRGQAAVQIASSSPLSYASAAQPLSAGGGGGNKSNSFSVGAINVHSNASDPKEVSRHVVEQLNKQFGHAMASADNGVAY